MPILFSLFLTLLLVGCGLGDTPANCTFDDVRGTWVFYESARNHTADIDCSKLGSPVHKSVFKLDYPNIATDKYGNEGTWTMVYNQGFEVRVGGRSYFAFSYYNKTGQTVNSLCDRTFVGWSRDITVRNWACFEGRKTKATEPKKHVLPQQKNLNQMFKQDKDFINRINAAQISWTAKEYPEFENMTLGAKIKMAGATKLSHRATPRRSSLFARLRSMILPKQFDWTNVSNTNYVSPVRNQGQCGSCYAFASMAALEARVRILTRNEQTPVFSVQDILECSKLSQACDGGFAYLIAGRYGQDHGVVLEECSKYSPSEAKNVCSTDPTCQRHYTAYYRYVGGFFGGCSEEEMKLALVKGGPLMVGIEVYSDFSQYAGGIYHHTGLTSKFNPLEDTNHAVLLVGFGEDEHTKEKFWIVKNSWGSSWGEHGFFRIRRGTDECAIESMALEVVPIPA